MALIECTLQRDEPVIVPIGNEKYEFVPDAAGRRVAEVWIKSHIEAFLAVPHLYRQVEPAAREDGRKRPDVPDAQVQRRQPEAEPAKPESKPRAKSSGKAALPASTAASPAI